MMAVNRTTPQPEYMRREKEAIRRATDVLADIRLDAVASRIGVRTQTLSNAANVTAPGSRLVRLGPRRLMAMAEAYQECAAKLNAEALRLMRAAMETEPLKGERR